MRMRRLLAGAVTVDDAADGSSEAAPANVALARKRRRSIRSPYRLTRRNRRARLHRSRRSAGFRSLRQSTAVKLAIRFVEVAVQRAAIVFTQPLAPLVG